MLKFTAHFTSVHLYTYVAKAVTSRRSREYHFLPSCFAPKYFYLFICHRWMDRPTGWMNEGGDKCQSKTLFRVFYISVRQSAGPLFWPSMLSAVFLFLASANFTLCTSDFIQSVAIY